MVWIIIDIKALIRLYYWCNGDPNQWTMVKITPLLLKIHLFLTAQGV